MYQRRQEGSAVGKATVDAELVTWHLMVLENRAGSGVGPPATISWGHGRHRCHVFFFDRSGRAAAFGGSPGFS